MKIINIFLSLLGVFKIIPYMIFTHVVYENYFEKPEYMKIKNVFLSLFGFFKIIFVQCIEVITI